MAIFCPSDSPSFTPPVSPAMGSYSSNRPMPWIRFAKETLFVHSFDEGKNVFWTLKQGPALDSHIELFDVHLFLVCHLEVFISYSVYVL